MINEHRFYGERVGLQSFIRDLNPCDKRVRKRVGRGKIRK